MWDVFDSTVNASSSCPFDLVRGWNFPNFFLKWSLYTGKEFTHQKNYTEAMMSRLLPARMFCQVLFSSLWFGVAGGLLVAQQPSRPMPEPDAEAVLLRQGGELPAAIYESRLLVRVLGLTPEQRRQMREIRRQEGPALNAARRAVFQCRQALTEAIYGVETSESLVEQRARDLAAAEAELTQLRARMQYHIRTVLTSDQVRILNELRADPGTLQPRTLERPGQRQPGRPPAP